MEIGRIGLHRFGKAESELQSAVVINAGLGRASRRVIRGGLRYGPVSARFALIAVACFLSLAASAQTASDMNGDGMKRPRGMTRAQFEKISDFTTGPRKIAILPVATTSGITSGVIVAYGHVIPPPYHVEYSNDNRLLINGVQVTPSLVKERHRHEQPIKGLPPGKQVAEQQAGELILTARKIYDEAKSHGTIEQAQQQVLDALAKHSDLIQHAKWQREALCYMTPAYAFSRCVNFAPAPSSLAPNPKQAEIETKNKAMEVAQIEMRLRQGQWVFFGSMGGMSTMKSPRAVVNQIMTDSSLTNEQKADELKERALHSYDLALDVIENYDPTEWRERK